MNVVINNDKGRYEVELLKGELRMLRDELEQVKAHDAIAQTMERNANIQIGELRDLIDKLCLEIKRAKNTYSLEELFKHLEAAQALAEKELKNKDTI